jgi:hypothetical protein
MKGSRKRRRGGISHNRDDRIKLVTRMLKAGASDYDQYWIDWLADLALKAPHGIGRRPLAKGQASKAAQHKKIYDWLRDVIRPQLVAKGWARKRITAFLVAFGVKKTGLSAETVRREARLGGNKRPRRKTVGAKV